MFQLSSMDWWNWHRNSGGAYMSLNGGRWQGIISTLYMCCFVIVSNGGVDIACSRYWVGRDIMCIYSM